MTDHLSPEKRSENMSRIRGKDTTPELFVRRMLHRLGFRFRLYRRDIPGNPDIVLPKYKTAIFIHGCYWHRHKGCHRGQSVPNINREFWLNKFRKNQMRDVEVRRQLEKVGWRILVIWECEVKPRRRTDLEARLLKDLKFQSM